MLTYNPVLVRMMKAMLLEKQPGELVLREMPRPVPGSGEVLLKVGACAVCRTDLHIIDGELTAGVLPVVPGHEIVGEVVEIGSAVRGIGVGDRVGAPWLGWTCGECADCRRGDENLCERAQFTGYDRNGGFAEFTVVDHRYCFHVPPQYDDAHAAPLLCAGLIGYRALRFAGNARTIGLYGFGAAAHLIAQLIAAAGRACYAFTRPGDEDGQAFARKLGAVWAGGSDETPPDALEAALIFAPVGALVPRALKAVRKGGVVVCAGIHMTDIPSFPYALLWGERVVRSVANLTRRDGEEFLAAAGRTLLDSRVTCYPLEDANRAVSDVRAGRLQGAAVLILR